MDLENENATDLGRDLQQERLLQEALKYIRSRNLIHPNDRILVAVSGGLDSTVLGHLLARARRLLNVHVEFAHVDHRTRAVVSQREGDWVRVLGERQGVETHQLRLERDHSSGSSQAELRSARRKLLMDFAAERGLTKIATAHHADDNAETFLMRAIAGSGVSGLGAIAAAEGIWIRPMLWATKLDLESYARAHRLAWVEDPSNARGDYLRNQLRSSVMPILESVRQGAIKNLGRVADRVDEEESAYEQWIEGHFEGPVELLSLALLEKWPRPLQRRALKTWTRRLGLDYDSLLVEALLRGEDLIHNAGTFLRRSDTIVFSPEREFGSGWSDDLPIELGKRINLGSSTAWSFLPGSPEKVRNVDLSVYFMFRPPGMAPGKLDRMDWEKLPWPLVFRSRQKEEKSVAYDQALAKAKIPKPFWKRWPLIVSQADPSQVVGIFGAQIFDKYRLEGVGRCVSVECFFEDRLKGLSHSC